MRQRDESEDINPLGLNSLGVDESARFFSVPQAHPLDCLAARFRRHSYAPHTHDAFVVGTIVAGCETLLIGGCRHYAGPGDLCLIDPGVVHDGEPAGPGFAYRISYPSAAFLADAAADATERRPAGTPRFPSPVVTDPELATRFAAIHRLAESGGRSLGVEEGLLAVFLRLLTRHGGDTGALGAALDRGMPREDGPVARAVDYLDSHFSEAVDLTGLARIAGIPRTRLIRAMRRNTGLTPHAWLTDRRVRAARDLLAAGGLPADVAVACGFYDQSHLNRAFKARIGVPPGAFRAAHRPPGPAPERGTARG